MGLVPSGEFLLGLATQALQLDMKDAWEAPKEAGNSPPPKEGLTDWP